MSRINFFIGRRWRIRSTHWPGGGLKAIRSYTAQSSSTLTRTRMLEASALVVNVGTGRAYPPAER
ncbi:MAG: hypothetical protein IH830_10340 [Planctomycetes bacterium]|nr:hypothetical protein [Planctomycetota bacterium]